MTQQTDNRETGLDVIRAMAITMVITIHIAGSSMNLPVGSANWWSATVWGVVARPAVPLFFMCSGALMLGRDIPLRRLYGHNMSRIIVAMLVWALGYQLVDLTPGQLNPAGLWSAVKNTLTLNHEFHFYYLHILILVYAFLPVTQTFVRGASRRELEYLLIFWFITGISLPLLQSFSPFSLVYAVGLWYRMNMAYSAIGFGVLGWYLKRYGGELAPKWYVLAWSMGLAITFGGTAFFSLRGGVLDERFLEGMSPGPMLMALGLFGLMANRKKWSVAVVRASRRLALSAFCVYLIHILIMHMEIRLGLDLHATPCLIVLPLSLLAVLIPSHLCWEVLRHIPIVKDWLI